MHKLCYLLEHLVDVLCNEVRPIIFLGPIVEQVGPLVLSDVKPGPKPDKRSLLFMFTMSDSQQTTMSVKFVDKKGNAAPVDGIPEWSTDNTDVLVLTPAADGLSCLVAAAGPLGSGTITLKADADLGAGNVPIIGTVEVTITGGTATTVTIDPGTPIDQS